MLSLHDSNKCFLKLKGGWSAEGKDGFWYFLSKPQQMIARKASYPSAPLLLLFIIITIIINHIDKIIIITINYISIIHSQIYITITTLNAKNREIQRGSINGLHFFGVESVAIKKWEHDHNESDENDVEDRYIWSTILWYFGTLGEGIEVNKMWREWWGS